MPGDTGNSGDAAAAFAAELDRLTSGAADGATGGTGGGALGVAVSGGGDSVALLLIANRWAAARGWRLRAATVDHGLRPESAAEAAGVAALCARLGLPHETLPTGDLRAEGGNLAAAAREARFAGLAGWAARHGLAAVLLGHTMDDQAETLLMRLARGSGIEGLAAMDAAVRRHGTLWLRPLLGTRRAALRAVLRAENVGWVEDPTNEDPAHDRVRARRALEALGPLGLTVEDLARSAAHLRRQRRVLERAMASLAARARRAGALGEAALDVAAMAADEEDTALRLLADTLRRVAGAAYRPRFATLAAAWEAMQAAPPRKTTLAGCLVLPAAGGADAVTVCREPAACEGPRPLRESETASEGEASVWDRRWRITAAGPWPPGTRLDRLGEAGLAALRAAGERGEWTSSETWATAAREVRLTTPGVWSGAEPGQPALLAAPLAGYLRPDLAARGCAVSAQFSEPEELPPPLTPE